MHMYPTIQETGPVGKVQIGQKAVREVLQPQSHATVSHQQQQQLAQQQQMINQQLQQQIQQQQQVMQQMRQQMIDMQAELTEYRKPKPKAYTTGQVQILLSAETINHVIEEFELSTQKRDRLLLARDWLLKLSDLSEWIPASAQLPQSQEEQNQQIEEESGPDEMEGEAVDEDDDQIGRQYGEDELCEEEPVMITPPGAASAQKQPEPSLVSAATEVYKGKIDPETASELEKIEQRMEELKHEPSEKLEQPKHKTGIEKIKGFFTKKSPEDDHKPALDYSNIPEGMG